MKRAARLWSGFQMCLIAFTTSLAFAAQVEQTSSQDARSQYAISLSPSSAPSEWTLRGVSDRQGIVFGLRQDERVEKLTLDLTLSYSPALLEDLSHLNVLLNGQIIRTVSLPSDESARQKKITVELPRTPLEPYNVLELQLIGHYTLDCEDPLHESLWAIIDPSSELIFDVERLALPDDLGMLPAPFFDAQDLRMQKTQFVLSQPSERRVEAAGILASWLGTLASYRGTEFSVMSDQLPPKGHAIVVLGPNDTFPGVSIPAIEGPTLAVRANPHDPTGKLLLVMGRNDDEIRSAAVSLAVGAQTLSGKTSQVTEVQIKPRKPYDAPNWLPTDRPVYLGELLANDGLTASGFDPAPITLGVRLPPDLSGWRSMTAPMDLRYRYTPIPTQESSSLSILINQQFVKEIKLGESYDGVWGAFTQTPGLGNQSFALPLQLLESQAELQFKFKYPDPVRAECSGNLLDTYFSAIDPRSTIDLSGLPHHMAMPDMAAFRTAGFPYSRMADLSETIIVVPEISNNDVLATTLTVLGKIGQTTGYPATGVTIKRYMTDLQDKDILVINSGETGSLPDDWKRRLPLPALPTPVTPSKGWFEQAIDLVTTNPFGHPSSQPFTPPSDGVYVAGFESPVTDGRSVVVIAGSDAASMHSAVQFMLFDNAQARHFQGALVSVRDDRITSLSGERSYHVGSLGPYQSVLWFLSGHPAVLFIIFLIGALLSAVVLYLSLRARANRRLMIDRDSEHPPKDNM